MISLARLYRYRIVTNGYPGDIVNGMGRQVDDFKGFRWCTMVQKYARYDNPRLWCAHWNTRLGCDVGA